MANEIENPETDLDDPIAEDQEQQRNFQQQTQSLRRLAKERAKAKAKQQVKKVAKKAVKKAIKKFVIRGIIALFASLSSTILIWGPIVLAIIAIIYIAINACSIPGFSAFVSVGALFSDNAEFVKQICGSFAG